MRDQDTTKGKRTSGGRFKRQHSSKNNPYCINIRDGVTCKTVMSFKRASRYVHYQCAPCGYWVPAHSQGHKPRRLQIAISKGTYHVNAWCLACQVPMKNSSAGRWKCTECGASCNKAVTNYNPLKYANRAKPNSQIDGDEMLRVIDSKLRSYSVEMREDLRQEIATAIMGRSRIKGQLVTIYTLTPANVKEIARPLFRMQPNRFRDVSLDHQYGEAGQRLEERLAG